MPRISGLPPSAGIRNTKSARTDSFPIRFWDRWLDDRQIHVFVQSLDAGSQPVDLLAGTKLIQNPGTAAGGSIPARRSTPVWAPDGQSIVFAATTNRNAAVYADVHTQIYQVPAAGGRAAAADAAAW